ncbi:hypothetical protein ES332_D12G102800v1 [Gossypium tomentosum]|uniref:Uncharacterized protein n=1 Tax=Gossypium tomentosum TaxID=34277 RepID=A0A5D2I6W6_GOSTO|nr:hypothetical protein ES332_D12G102800v1 [Gossypium tomentosum]
MNVKFRFVFEVHGILGEVDIDGRRTSMTWCTPNGVTGGRRMVVTSTCLEARENVLLRIFLPVFETGSFIANLYLPYLLNELWGTIEVHSSSSNGPNSKLLVSKEDPIEFSIKPITCARSKKLKEAMLGLIQQIWAEHEKSNSY